MRRLGLVLFVIGVFLVVTAPLVRWYVAPRMEKAPTDSTTELTLTGGGQRFSLATGSLQPITITGTRTVYAREAVSSKDVTIYDSYVTVTDAASGTTISETGQRVALDRHTGQAVNVAYDSFDNSPSDTTGLVLKFPFHAERKNYDFFDGKVNKAFPARFVTTEKLNGIEVYRYVQDVPQTPVKLNLRNDPGNLLDGFYQNKRTIWVEPTTGVIVKGQEEQQQWLAVPNESPRQIADLTLRYDDATVAKQVNEAKDGVRSLDLIGLWVPLGAAVLGLVLIIIGVILGARGARREPVYATSGAADPDLDDWPSGPLTDNLPKHASN